MQVLCHFCTCENCLQVIQLDVACEMFAELCNVLIKLKLSGGFMLYSVDMQSYQSDNDHSRLPSPTSMKPTIREAGAACRLRVHVYMLEMPRRATGLKGELCLNFVAFGRIFM